MERLNTGKGFNFPLGGKRWLEATYNPNWAVATGELGKPPWTFALGGEMTPDQWPDLIAESLAHLPRFGRRTNGRTYSVGRHSVLIRQLLDEQAHSPAAQLVALLHDAAEGLGVGDQNTFLKRLTGKSCSQYEHHLLLFLLDQMGVGTVSDRDHEVVHSLDQVFGGAECRLFEMHNGQPWPVSEDNHVLLWLGDANHVYDVSPERTQQDWLIAWQVVMAIHQHRRPDDEY